MGHHRVIALMGPTASGKTALALALAQHFAVEIISVDSALVYRDMNIGTAKPSDHEQRICPHHLIDIISPMDSYSAAQFHTDAHRLISAIQSRGRIPLLVGGTMLYFKALQQGLSKLPQANAALRHHLTEEAAKLGWPAMHAWLATLDAITAARVHPSDSQRIQRALEVCLLAGTPMSQLLAQQQQAATRFTMLSLALLPTERQWLHTRIEVRFKHMLERGLVAELSQLRQQYPALSLDMPSMRCVGYRQAWNYQEGLYSYDEFVAKGLTASRQLAKRQLTWLRSMNVVPIDAQCPAACDKLLHLVNIWCSSSLTS